MDDAIVGRIRPLAALAASTIPSPAVTLAELPPATRLSIRAGGDAVGAIGVALGVTLPNDPCRAASAGDRHALWLGPDEWLLLAPEGAASLAQAAQGILASVVDVSHRQTAIEVAGPKADVAINAFCALDLDLSAFPVGMCTRTLFGKAEIVLWRTGNDTFHLEAWRSFAPYVWECLEEARLEFGV